MHSGTTPTVHSFLQVPLAKITWYHRECVSQISDLTFQELRFKSDK